jgi:methionyl-tRNA synthetase
MEDIDLNLDDFIARVNADLVGKLVNIASRSAGFISQRFAGQLCTCDESLPALQVIDERQAAIAEYYEAREFGKAVREIMALADLANQYVDSVKPWEMAKQPGRESELQQACSNALNLFRRLIILLKPVLPALAGKVESFFSVAPFSWDDVRTVLAAGHAIRPYRHLMTRVDKKQIAALTEANRESLTAVAPTVPPAAPQKHAEHKHIFQ